MRDRDRHADDNYVLDIVNSGMIQPVNEPSRCIFTYAGTIRLKAHQSCKHVKVVKGGCWSNFRGDFFFNEF